MSFRIPRRPRAFPAKTSEVFEILKKRTTEKELITYGELAKQVGLATLGQRVLSGISGDFAKTEGCRI